MDSSDAIDRIMAAWSAVLPGLDPSPLALVGRVIVLAQHLERSVEIALEKHNLSLGQFDILGTLRRTSPKGGLTPSQILESVMLSSGGMTARLDSLEAAKLIYRKSDPKDRRTVVIGLTARGRRVIDAAAATRFEEAAASLPPLSKVEQDILANFLRRWLSDVAG